MISMIGSAILLYVICMIFYIAYTVIEHYWGHMTHDTKVTALAQVRLHSAIMNTLIFAFITFLIVLMMGDKEIGIPGIVSYMVNPDPSLPVQPVQDYVYDYFSKLVFEYVPLLMTGLFGLLAGVQAASSVFGTYSIGAMVTGTAFDFSMIEKIVTFMFTISSPLLGSIYVQFLVVMVIVNFSVQFLLPAGFVLRFFDFTRRAGNFMVSLAVASSVIFIMMYALNGYIMQNMISVSGLADEVDSVCEKAYISMHSFPDIRGDAYDIAGDVLLAGLTFIPVQIMKHILKTSFKEIFFWFPFIIFQGIIVPTFSLIVTTTSINALMKWLDTFT